MISEKKLTDSKFNEFLEATARDAATGKLTVQKAKDRIFRMSQYLKQIDEPTIQKPKSASAMGEDVLKHHLQNLAYNQKLAVAHIARFGGAKRQEHEADPVFHDAILAIAGGNDSLATTMLARLKDLDAEFFDTIIRAIKVARKCSLAGTLASFRGQHPPEEVFSSHIFHALCVVMEIRKAAMPLPDSFTMRAIVSGWVGDAAYGDDFKHWRAIWKTIGIKLESQKTGRAKGVFNAKYRRFCKS